MLGLCVFHVVSVFASPRQQDEDSQMLQHRLQREEDGMVDRSEQSVDQLNAEPPMVVLELDSNKSNVSTSKTPSERQLQRDLIGILQDSIEYVQATEGEGAARYLREAITVLSDGGPSAIAANATLQSVVKDALNVESQEVDADWAQQNGVIITLDELMAINGLTETPEYDPMCIEGDMCAEDINGFNLLQERAARGFRSAINPFPSDATIKTCVYDGTTQSAANAFRQAQEQFKRLVPCAALEFEEVTYESGTCNIIVTSRKPGCSAIVGQISKTRPTIINLGAGCTGIGIAAHELGHALGMMHEHSRIDRDEYVEIHWDNIQSGLKGNFGIASDAIDDSVPYDLGSLMHYGGSEFSTNGEATVTIKDGVETKVMGNRLGLTGFDAKQLGKMYGCASETNWHLCPKDGNGCSTEECICQQDMDGAFPIIKATVDGCHRCVRICSDDGSLDCGCPPECTAEEVVVADEANKMRCVMSGTELGCLAHNPLFAPPPGSRKRRRRRRRKNKLLQASSGTISAPASTAESLHSEQCIDLVEESVCSKHAESYCEYDGQVSVTVRNKGITLAFATEACAKTCNKC